MRSKDLLSSLGRRVIKLINDVLNKLRDNPKDLIILASWFYKIGEPIITDAEYNTLASKYGDLDIVWDEVDKPIELFNKYGIEDVSVDFNESGDNHYFNEYMDLLYESDTKSISPEYTYSDIYSRFCTMKSITDELVISLKVDGVSTRNVIENDKDTNIWYEVASLSRSRESKGFDYTDGMKLAMPKELRFNNDAGIIHEVSGNRVILAFGEAYVERTALEYLRNKYHMQDTWKTPRSTALSMLRNVIAEEDYKFLKFKCFKLNVGDTLVDMFKQAEEAGLDVVPYEVIKTSDIPTSYDDWEVWFNDILTKYNNIQNELDIEADGIVVAVNNQVQHNSLGTSTNNKYNNAVFSCKVGPWDAVSYKSKVVAIHFDNKGNKSEFSVVAEIEPVVVSNGNTVTRVNCFNPKILISNGINIGKEIEFEYKSASSVNLIYK